MNVTNFIRAEDWPISSHDFYLLDYDLRSVLKIKACSKRHDTIGLLYESLKQFIRLAVKNFYIERVSAATHNWSQRLKYCTAANGDHFE